MKKNILIVSHAMEIGGAERALLGLLNCIDTDRYDVDLFLYRHTGELMKLIPQNIHLLPESAKYKEIAVPIMQTLKHRQFKIAWGRFQGKRKAVQYVKKHFPGTDNQVALTYSHQYTMKYMPMISDKEYDLAISFLTPHYYVAEKVMAKKKIAWIHTDYSFIQVDVSTELEMWNQYDDIVSISDHVTEAFLKKFPSLRDKIILIENIVSPQFIRQQAELRDEVLGSSGSQIKLLSIGRFSNAKNFDNIPDICRRIVRRGMNIKWYLIGYGGDEALIKSKIAEARMEECVIILGKKDNPYPYIKACDLYVQPSRYEGKAVTVREAQILGKPVIITDYPTAKSQLQDGVDGIIVPLDNESCAEGIIRVLEDKPLQRTLIENCRKHDYGNAKEVGKIYRLLEG